MTHILICLLVSLSGLAQENRLIVVANLTESSPIVNQQKDAFFSHIMLEPNTRLVLLGDCELGEKVSSFLKKVDEQNISIDYIAGDKDWKEGQKSLDELESHFANSYNNANIFPRNGCPGPDVFYEDSAMVLIAINSQWWMQKGRKQVAVDAECKLITNHQITEELEEIIEDNNDKQVIVLTHHPVLSSGLYGGGNSLKAHLFPFIHDNPSSNTFLPFFGTFYHSYRQNQGTRQDHNSNEYITYRNDILKALEPHKNVIFCSGHEYNTQLNEFARSFHLNAGAGGEVSKVSNSSSLIHRSSQSGFAQLDVSKEKCKMDIYDVNDNEFEKTFTGEITWYSGWDSFDEIKYKSNEKDSLITGGEYQAGLIKKAMLGSLYRSAWIDSVRIPFLDMENTFGGLEAYSLGGGRQTTSLKLRNSLGETYVFRSVNKNPVKALPMELRGSFVEILAKDMTATQHPYGALVVADLLGNTSIIHATPRLFLLPYSENLKQWQPHFSGLFGMLEEKPWNKSDSLEGFAGSDKIVNTLKLFSLMYRSPKNQVDTLEYLKARVFDIMIGDWGRHEDNWKWAKFKEKDRNLYRPIPRDRDHVFSRWNGLIPYLGDRKWARPNTENFGKNFSDIKSLNWQNRHYDRYLFSSMVKQDFLAAAKSLQNEISNEDIAHSIQKLPEEVIPNSGKEIEEKLVNRKAHLEEAAAKYYELLAKTVDVVGTNKKERFSIISEGGKLTVIIESIYLKKEIYKRTFSSKETHEVNVYGLNGDDIFIISGSDKSGVKIRIVPGQGVDELSVKEDANTARISVYSETNLKGADELKVIYTDDVYFSEFNRTKFRYNTYLPLPILSFNADDGLAYGASLSGVTHGYDYKIYKSIYSISASASSEGSQLINFKFDHYLPRSKWKVGGDFRYGDYFAYYNFFGVGNSTLKVDSLELDDYYLTRLRGFQLEEFVSVDILQSSVFKLSINQEFLEDETIFNVADSYVDVGSVKARNVLGTKQLLDLNFTDTEKFTSKGIRLKVGNELFTSSSFNNSFGKTSVSLQHYSSFKIIMPLTLKFEGGIERTYGNDIPYYHLASLGQTHKLRGFLSERFAGSGANYFNSDLRIHLGKNKSNVLPLYYGFNVFFDAGQIVGDAETSKEWHYAYGAGIYLAPISKELLTLRINVASSVEEPILFKFGIGLFIN